MKRQDYTMIIDLDALPDLVNARDEDLFANVCETLCRDKGIDPRFGNGNNLDEYHAIPLNEMYPSLEDKDWEEVDADVVLVPKQEMIDYASDDLDYYATHQPDDHEGGDVTKPSKREEGGDAQCIRCELDEQFAFEDSLIALGLDERLRRVRAYLDQFMPTEYQPYELIPSKNNVFYYRVFHYDEEIGSAQFNDSIEDVAVPLVPGPLFDIQQRHFGRPTNEDREREMREKYPHLFES